MLVTDPAFRDMEARADNLLDRIGRFFGKVFKRSGPAVTPDGPFSFAPEHQAHLHLVPALPREPHADADRADDAGGEFKWRRHPQLLNGGDPIATLDTEDIERGARSAAVRGLFLARSGRFDDARSAFAVAAAETTVDLTAIPGFWELSRGGMLAAVHAYADVERYREASALEARIRLKYRPRSVAATPDQHGRRRSASGS